jgi:hypothetical protein
MAKKAVHPSSKRAAARPGRTTAKARAEEDAYTRSLLAHGQAARPDADGRLPPGATHEIVEEAGGRLRAVRRRFSTT